MSSIFSINPDGARLTPGEESRPLRGLGFRVPAAIVLAVLLADLTIYRGHGYTGIAAFLLGVSGLLVLGRSRRSGHAYLWILGVMLMLLAGRLFWYGSPLQASVGFFLVIALATALDGQKPYVPDVLTMGLQSITGGIRAFWEYSRHLQRMNPRLHYFGIWSIVVPVLACLAFGALFVLANPDVVRLVVRQLESLVTTISAWFVRMDIGPAEPIFWIAVALIVAGLLRPGVRLSSLLIVPTKPSDDHAATAPLFSICRNTLAAVIGLFAVYLVFEFHTLWTRDFPVGFYYAGYAHEGAAWLTVALALASAILSLIFSGSVLKDSRLAQLRLLAWIWSLENLLLSLSVYNRLFIYIDFNGMTWMRILGIFGISVVVAGFLLVVWKVARGKDFAWLIHRQLWALVAAVYLFALTPVDALAASYNVRRILAGDISASMQIGVQELDREGILALPPLLDSPIKEIREGSAALIAEGYFAALGDQLQHQQDGWTAYQISDEFAIKRFAAVRDRWKPYEDVSKRRFAIQQFYRFAYRWY